MSIPKTTSCATFLGNSTAGSGSWTRPALQGRRESALLSLKLSVVSLVKALQARPVRRAARVYLSIALHRRTSNTCRCRVEYSINYHLRTLRGCGFSLHARLLTLYLLVSTVHRPPCRRIQAAHPLSRSSIWSECILQFFSPQTTISCRQHQTYLC